MSIAEWLKANKLKLIPIVISVFIVLAIVTGIIVFHKPETNHNQIYGTVKIGLDSPDPTRPWTQHEREVIAGALHEAERLGPTFVLTSVGQADVVIYRWVLNCNRDGAAFYYNNQIYIDPGCVHSGDIALRNMAIHELGHHFGMHHICLSGQTVNAQPTDLDSCSPLGSGKAIMNTGVEGEYSFDPEDRGSDLPVDSVTRLDILEFRRVWGLAHPGVTQPRF